MTKTKKTALWIFVSIAVIIALIFGAIGILHLINRGSLKFDTEKGGIASQKVETAQYTPDIDKFIAVNNSTSISSIATARSPSTLEDFNEIVQKYATVENYAGAGKYLGYDIYEIKNEIQFVVDNVPAFNQWFRLPTMREEQGYISIPYYEGWAYYLELNEENKALSITRVCWATRTSYLDFENRKTIEDHEDGSSIIQFEIMKTNYFFDEENNEVVECYLYSVAVDHTGIEKFSENFEEFITGEPQHTRHFNPNTSDYYPLEFQYLKNVKDKLLIKYHITVSQRYAGSESFDDGGQDLRGETPYGIRREFMIVNYGGYKDIDLTEIDQKFATLDHSEYNGAVDFDVSSDNIKLLVKQVGMKQSDIENLDSKELLDKISKHIIDNFEIKNNWPNIYENSDLAYEIEIIKGPFYEKNIMISDVSSYVSARDYDKDILEFDANADVYDMSYFDLNKEYSLSLALKSRETGKLTIIATSYAKLEKVNYNGSTTEFYHRLKSTHLDLDASCIKVDEDGVYDLVCVLTEKGNNNDDIILVDTLEPAYLRGYSGLIIPDSVQEIDKEHSITHHYSARGAGGKITITVTSSEN